jgi:hypothetical protein
MRDALQAPTFDLDVSRVEGLPDRAGVFRSQGIVRATDRQRILLAQGLQLDLATWLWLRPVSEPALDSARREIGRVTRMRWVTCGVQDEWQWDPFIAPAGVPLPPPRPGR